MNPNSDSKLLPFPGLHQNPWSKEPLPHQEAEIRKEMNLFSCHQGERATKTPHQKSVIQPSHTLENQTLKHTGNSWIQALTQSETSRDTNPHSQEGLQAAIEGRGSKGGYRI
jgi:hypothetical protein